MNVKKPSVSIAIDNARKVGYGLGRVALAADVKARIELLPQSKTIETTTGRYVLVEDLFALIDDEVHRAPA